MSYEVKRLENAKLHAKKVLGTDPTDIISALTVLASPAWRGVEGDVWRASSEKKSMILKYYHTDTSFYVDHDAAIEGATEAGNLDVAPPVIGSWVNEGIVAFEELPSPWIAGGLHHTINPEIRANTIELKKRFQSGAILKKSVSIFDEINALFAITKNECIPTHKDIIPFMDFAKEAELKLRSSGWDSKPCHRDGNTANLMVHTDNSVRLIDFDLAANCDPYEDIGFYLVEFFENDIDARGGFEEWHGSFEESLFQRSMIYGMIDDLRWGLIGSIMGDRSSRTALEFTKYAAWRFLRLEAQATRSEANDRIRLAH